MLNKPPEQEELTKPSMLSQVNQRRLMLFKQNRRAYYSLWIFGFLFFSTLFAELIANNAPLIVYHNSSLYFPIVTDYTETEFGGDLDLLADYQDPYIRELINKDGWMLSTIIPYSYDTNMRNATHPFPSPPDSQNWLGTDDQGRDVLARIIYGFRISVLFGLVLTVISSVIGIGVGAVQGYYGGKIDLIGQRLIEVWSGLPVLFLLIILSSFVTPGFWWLLGIMLLFSWTSLVDVVRAEFLRGRNLEYVKAAKALGVSDSNIMFKHILPNAMVASLTFMPFILTGSITTLTSLDFLGFGMPPGSASLGELTAQGKNNLHAPWLGMTAFIVLSIMLTLLVFVWEGVRDAFDPHNSGDA